MPRELKRQKVIRKMNLSDHTLDINISKCNYDKFNFTELEDYARALVGSRDYQYDVIKQVMIYLWGGSYNSITDLAKDNYLHKPQIRHRFGNEENFLHHLPLPDRLSGVVHMATGTGKSFVIFAIAYLSIVMGPTKRVLVLGPSSTIIEQGLREKFRELMNKQELNEKLPQKFHGKAINLLTDNDPIEDDSIVIENINATYTFGSITDTLFKNTNEVLVLGDEIHHAYSHLKFSDNRLVIDTEIGKEGRGEARDERLWMRFLREHKEITRHIGFTGTPYNQNEYFADIVNNYSIKDATEQKYIKKINAIIRTETDEGDSKLTIDQRFEMVLKNHNENKEKYNYSGIVKPITVFICPTQTNAQKRSEEFIGFLARFKKKYADCAETDSELIDKMRKKVICVISRISDSEFKDELDHIEEIDPKKTGGSVEFIFAVNKLSEGWDVDNVFQIVPMEERVFNSKLLISQVLGRGMRLPRNASGIKLLQNYPLLTVTNHDKFGDHIKELVDSVTQSDMYLFSSTLPRLDQGRGQKNFALFNLNYIPNTRLEKLEDSESAQRPGELILAPFEGNLGVNVIRIKDEKRYELARNFSTVDEVAYDIYQRFRLRTFEALHFDFGSVVVEDRYPEEKEIRQVILTAMNKAGIEGNKLSEENKKQINLYFNQFLPQGKKKRVFENIEGDLQPIDTSQMDKSGKQLSELERDTTAFLSEDYESEVGEENKLILEYVNEMRGRPENEDQMTLFKPDEYVQRRSEIIRPLVVRDTRSPYVVNTSKLKSPQNVILVSHGPEKMFVFLLIENSQYIHSWIKSPDKHFYSIGYEYWKGGKDRVRRSYNPDFFIKIDLVDYVSKIEEEGHTESLEELKKLQDEGIETVIKVVEIKSDEESDEATPAKEEYAKAHLEKLNEKLRNVNIADIEQQYWNETKQHYTFDLLIPHQFQGWFVNLRKGKLQ